MNLDTLLRAAQILRTQPAATMALVKLHACLHAEVGPAAGTYAQLYQELKRRPQSFAILDVPRLLTTSQSWPACVREDYESALSDAGLGAQVRVALTELAPDHGDNPLALAGSTVSGLWRALGDDPTLLGFLDSAARQIEEISSLLQPDAAAARPTTPAPDLPRAW